MSNWLDCGYCHLINAVEVESIINRQLIHPDVLSGFIKRGIDLSGGNRIRSLILMKGGTLYLSSTSPETLKRRLLED